MVRQRAKGWAAWRSSVRCAAGLGVGTALALGGGTPGAARAAGEGTPCWPVTLDEVPKGFTAMLIPNCEKKGQHAYGKAQTNAKWKIVIPNQEPEELRDCKVDESPNMPGRCFSLPDAGDPFDIGVLGENGKPLQYLVDNTEVATCIVTFIAAPATDSEHDKNPKYADKNPPPDAKRDTCASAEPKSETAIRCAAYEEGVRQLWTTESDSSKRKNAITEELQYRQDWVANPYHIEHLFSNRYVLFFNGDGTPMAPLPQVDEDDRVVIVVISLQQEISEVRVTTCANADPARIGGSGKPAVRLSKSEEQNKDITNNYQVVVANRCSSDTGIAAVVRLKGKNESSHDVKVSTLSLYQFTVGVGLIYDFAHTVDFHAALVKGEAVPIIVRDEQAGGLAPPVVFVSWRPAAVDAVRGRWPEVYKWLGLSLGASLTEPLDHVYLGGLLEPYPGIGLVGGFHFHKVKSLAGGYQVGDRFSGGGDVPVDKRWQLNQTSGFVGLDLDSTVFTRLLKVIQ